MITSLHQIKFVFVVLVEAFITPMTWLAVGASGRVVRRCTVSGSWDAYLWCNGVNLAPTSWTAWWKISYPIQLGEGGLGASPSLHRQNLAAVLVGWRGVNSERSPRRGCRSTWSSTALPPRKRQSLECSMSSCPGVGLGSPCLWASGSMAIPSCLATNTWLQWNYNSNREAQAK